MSQQKSESPPQFSSDFNIAPIITPTYKKSEEKQPPAPGLSFGIPGAFGASEGNAFIGLSYSAPTKTGPLRFYKDGKKKQMVR